MKTIKAVVGVLQNSANEILIAKRQAHQFMAGFWELPGGKIEPTESDQEAIIRELKEELDIVVTDLSIHQTLTYQYPDRLIKLNIYNINQYQNTPIGAEGQEITWSGIEHLAHFNLLPTMRDFINSITLPNKYWITPSSEHQSDAWMAKFDEKLKQGISLIQLRSKVKLDSDFIQQLYNQCHQVNAKLLLNIPNKTFKEGYCDGWHLTTNEMLNLKERPCGANQILSASTHDLNEALKAQSLGADFVVISPVQATQTHPDTAPIGWDAAKEVVDQLNIPVYFLGGMTLNDLNKTLNLGAQGIAGVSSF
ncbi:Nudix family hydrolase [Candidatus Thioglobus sp.]|nr:Nudix family hydrolase [Candidatus Thioglobus sp.]MDB9829195.1 Nudix family hydrolase [Candidatus Thioglobus sp.]MDC0888971.1 Nudix family hydrolase [Candidatus Thioglobus sp.]MDC0920488.1 Nudix family hydrolase [Candidatus Thioglobus sp.]MDC0964935.1 Nudix family hydrolase [Candidatus Thioglobus sp.]